MQISNLSFSGDTNYWYLLRTCRFSRLEFVIRFILSLSPFLCQFFSIPPLLVDYARRTKLFFSTIGRDYRLLAAKALRNPPRGGGGRKKARKQREIRRVNGWNGGQKRASGRDKTRERRKTGKVLTCDSLFREKQHSHKKKKRRFLDTRRKSRG